MEVSNLIDLSWPGQIRVSWVEFNINRPFVIHYAKFSFLGLKWPPYQYAVRHFGSKLFIDLVDFH